MNNYNSKYKQNYINLHTTHLIVNRELIIKLIINCLKLVCQKIKDSS